MYQTEIDKFSKKIDKQDIRMGAKRALHTVFEEFSEERKRKIQKDFRIDMTKMIYNISACIVFDLFPDSGDHSRVNINSEDKSVNIMGDKFLSDLEILIERDYIKEDKKELLQAIHEMKESCNDPSKKKWLIKKLGWLFSRTFEVASISSFALQNMK